jgi:DNA-binding transcriptional MerR regulator
LERPLSIGQLAHATGVAAKTIRFYEETGVLPTPRRTPAGYRLYARRDVHRILFIRRARALGLSLANLKVLIAELDGQPSRTMRPRLRQAVTDHLHAVRKQVADLQVLAQQLEQVLQRLGTVPSATPTEGCQCLESAVTLPLPTAPDPPPRGTRGGAEMESHPTMESITRLAIARNGDCDCGCSCAARGPLPVKQQAELPRRPGPVASLSATKERQSRAARAVASRVPRT